MASRKRKLETVFETDELEGNSAVKVKVETDEKEEEQQCDSNPANNTAHDSTNVGKRRRSSRISKKSEENSGMEDPITAVVNYSPSKMFEDALKRVKQRGDNGSGVIIPKRRVIAIIRANESVAKVLQECVPIFMLAIELFVSDLCQRSYQNTLDDQRKIVQLQDLCRAVQTAKIYDFLCDVVPRLPHDSHFNHSGSMSSRSDHSAQTLRITQQMLRTDPPAISAHLSSAFDSI